MNRVALHQSVVHPLDPVGLVRVAARTLPHRAAPGLLATLPPQVPVAIGGLPGVSGETAAPTGETDVARIAALRVAVDVMLRHPRAAGAGRPAPGPWG